jgi:hypothetical protein
MYQGTAAARADATLRARAAEAKAEGEAVVDAIETPKIRDFPAFHIIHFCGAPEATFSGVGRESKRQNKKICIQKMESCYKIALIPFRFSVSKGGLFPILWAKRLNQQVLNENQTDC